MAADIPFSSPLASAKRLLADIDKPARLIVAISGGSDSTGLLLALVKSNPPGSDVSIMAATIDHGLRPESADEARSVSHLCGRLGIPHIIRRWEGEKPKTGISAASREARYRLLVEIADEIDADAILTGHTIDDQAETVAMRAARDASDGNMGLAGMAPAVLLHGRRWLLRPLLSTSRADIRAFLDHEGEGWIDDPSNLNPRYERVRVRGALAASAAFDAKACALAGEKRTALSDKAAALLQRHATIEHGVLARLEPEVLNEDISVRNHAVSMLAAVLGGRPHGLPAESLRRVAALLDGGLPGRITAGRVIFDLRRDGLFFCRESRGMLSLHVSPGMVGVWDGRYRVVNGTDSEIIVGPTAPDRAEVPAQFPGVPPSIAMRAAASMPWVERMSVVPSQTGSDHIRVSPVLAPFDRFLPQFDVNLAQTLSVLLGCDVFPRPPIKDCARKS